MTEIVDIITNIELVAETAGAEKAAKSILNLTKDVETLTKERIRLGQVQQATAKDDIAAQKAIAKQIQANERAIREKSKAIINERVANADLNKEIQKEIGYLANLNQKLDALKNKQAMATTAKEVKAVNREIQALNAQLARAQGAGTTGGFLSSILTGVGLGAGSLGFAAAFSSIVGILQDATTEFEDAEKTSKDLDRTLSVIGQHKYFDGLKNEADGLATEFHNLFDNDEIIKAQSALVQYGKVSRNEISKLLPVILELASAEKIDLVQATEKVINILEGRGGQTLRDYGVSVKGVKTEHDRLNVVLGDFQTKLKGSADVYAETADGIKQSNKILLSNIEEQLGEYTSKLNLIFAQTKLGFFQLIKDLTTSSAQARDEEFKKELSERDIQAQKLTDKELALQVRQNKLRLKEITRFQNEIFELETAPVTGVGKAFTANRRDREESVKNLRKQFDAELASYESIKKEEIRRKYKLDADANKAINKNATLTEETEKKKAEKKGPTSDELAKKEKARIEALYKQRLDLAEAYYQQSQLLTEQVQVFGDYEESIHKQRQLEDDIRYYNEKILIQKEFGKDTVELEIDIEKKRKDIIKLQEARSKTPEKPKTPPPPINEDFPISTANATDVITPSVFTPEGEAAMIESGKVIKNNNEDIVKSFEDVNTIIQSVGDTLNQVTQISIDNIDKEIEAQQGRIDRAKKYAERGGAELLEQEEERLKQLEEKREKFARRQLQINAALALSNAIVAVATAAAETGVGAVVAIPAVLAAIAAGYSFVNTLQEPQSFAEGTKSVDGPGTETSDSIPANLSKGERVMPAKTSKKFKPILDDIQDGVFKDQSALIASIQAGKYSNGMNYASVINSSTTNSTSNKGIEQRLDAVVETLENQKVPVINADAQGLHSYYMNQHRVISKRNKY